MATILQNPWRALLADVRQRLPARARGVQEAFTSDHHHPVLVPLTALQPDTFYWFDEPTVCAFFDALVEWAAGTRGGELTVSYTTPAEAEAHRRRLQRAASRLERIRVLTVGRPHRSFLEGARLDVVGISGTCLAKYRLVLREAPAARVLIVREQRGQRSVGFFSADPDVVEELADDVNAVLCGAHRSLMTFEKLELLHQTTQRISRELNSYARRLQLAADRACRRPDLMTPARFERIIRQSIAKMEELQELPRRALREMSRLRD